MNLEILKPIQIPINLSNDLIEELNKVFGKTDLDKVDWIKASLIQRSYLNENNGIEITPNILETLGSLGLAFMDLLLHEVAREYNPQGNIGDYDKLVASIHYSVMNELYESFQLENLILKGKSISSESKVGLVIGKQFFGALILSYGYDTVKNGITPFIQKLYDSKKGFDYKTLLQEFTQGKKLGIPKYDVIDESGPDHDKRFVVRSSTPDGRSAEAEGNSKNSASKSAAKAYIMKYCPNLLANKIIVTNPTATVIGKNLPIVNSHKDCVISLCQKFNIDREKSGLFSQALTFNSYINESPFPLKSNKELAQMGSWVFITILTEIIAYKFLKYNDSFPNTITEYRSIISEKNNLIQLAKIFIPDNGILMGKGERLNPDALTLNQTEAFQAIIGAAYIGHNNWESFVEDLPVQMSDFLDQKLGDLLNSERKYIGPSAELQELLQALSLQWKFQFQTTGLTHALVVVASITIFSPTTKEKFSYTDNISFRSRREAAQHIASIIVESILIANGKITTELSNQSLSISPLDDFSRFLLNHELGFQLSQRDAMSWHKLGILGSKLLSDRNFYGFKIWATTVGNRLQSLMTPLIVENLISYYNRIPDISDNQLELLNKETFQIIRFVESLDPQKGYKNLQNSPEFAKVINLSKTYKLLSQNWISVNLDDTIDDFLLLRRGKLPHIQINNNTTNLKILEGEGTYQAILSETILLLEENTETLGNMLSISFDFDIGRSELVIVFDVNDNIVLLPDKIHEKINSNILWYHLRKEIPINNINILNSRIEINCLVHLSDNLFASIALAAYKQNTIFSKTEYQAASQFLHDLKNQLTALQVSLDTEAKDRTSVLRGKFDASLHIDKALSICRSLEAFSNIMTSIKIDQINIGEYIKQFISEKILAVPTNIRIETPKTVGDFVLYSSRDFLTSILENLTKNSIEAMPKGGEIQIEWLYDQKSNLFLLGFSDTGPGMDVDIVDNLKYGRLIDSTKHQGTGIGLLAITSMIERLGGKYSVKSQSGKGTYWSIEIPSITPQDVVTDNDAFQDENQGEQIV
ncbi:MAG: ATP-binding protein [Chloroflexota bacterium]